MAHTIPRTHPALPSARTEEGLYSPFVTDETHDRPVSALHRTQAQDSDAALSDHVPLKFDSMGRQIPVGKGAGIKIHQPGTYSNKVQQAVVPGKWTKPVRHENLSSLHKARRAARIPHHSFDLDGDGVVSPMDFFYATQFDKDGDGKLNKQERRACMEALEAGFGKQYYHVRASGPSESAHHRIMQRRGQVLAEDLGGWLPLHQTYTVADLDPAHKFAPYANSGPGGTADALDPSDTRKLCTTMGIKSRSELLRARKKREQRDLSRVGGVPVSARDDDDISVASFIATKPFNSTSGVPTVTTRAQLLKARKKQTLGHVLSAQGMSDAMPADTPRTDVTDPFDTGVTQGLRSLSRTKSELALRKKRLAAKEASKFAPTKAIGVHQTSPTKFGSDLGDRDVWYKDTRHMDKFAGTSWEGSELDGSKTTNDAGRVAGDRGRRVDATTGRPLVRNCGPAGDHVAPTDTFKRRTTSLQQLPLYQKKRMEHTAKPTELVLVDMDHGKPMKKYTMRRWTDVQIEYRLAARDDKSTLLDANGKTKLIDPKEYAPMYSSFSNDRIFREPRRESSPSQKKKQSESAVPRSRRRRSVYGTPIAANGFTSGGAADGDDGDDGDGEEDGDVFDAYHQVDYSRKPARPSLSRSQSAPGVGGSTGGRGSSSSLPSSPIGRMKMEGPSPAGIAPGFGHDGVGARRGTGSRPSTQPALPSSTEPDLGASMTRALSRRSSRRAGSGMSGSMRGAALLDADVTAPVAGVRSGGFQRVAATLLVSQ